MNTKTHRPINYVSSLCPARLIAIARALTARRWVPFTASRRWLGGQRLGLWPAAQRAWVVLLVCGALWSGSVSGPARAGSAAPSGQVPSVTMTVLTPILAQAGMEPSLDPIFGFLGKIMMLVGSVVLFIGGWKIYKGEPDVGVMAIIGGGLIAMAIPLIKYFFSIFGGRS